MERLTYAAAMPRRVPQDDLHGGVVEVSLDGLSGCISAAATMEYCGNRCYAGVLVFRGLRSSVANCGDQFGTTVFVVLSSKERAAQFCAKFHITELFSTDQSVGRSLV